MLFATAVEAQTTFRPNKLGTLNISSTGDWQTASNWDCGGCGSFPGSGDIVLFGNDNIYWGDAAIIIENVTLSGITFTASAEGAALTIGSGATVNATSINEIGKNTISINSGGTLTINNSLTLDNDGTAFNVDGDVTINGDLILSGGAAQTINSSGTLTVNGDLSTEGGSLNVTGGNVGITGDWTIPSDQANGNNGISISSGASVAIGGDIAFLGNNSIPNPDSQINIDGSFTFNGSCTNNDGGNDLCQTFQDINDDSLPVVLISLFGIQTEEGFLVKWTTASEQNNSHFIIEGSNSTDNWKEIAEVDGQGNTNTSTDYEIVLKGEQYSYYRLIQYDFDGSFEIFGILNQDISNTDRSVHIFPNEVNQGQFINLLFANGNADLSITLQLYDLIGNVLDYQSVPNYNSSLYQYKVPNTAKDGGYYILSVLIGNKRFHQKVLIK
ncbi:hypothetical protein AVL50_01920 [Flammeovirga sp. SJP92]|nr:hypothetical protein AVL50_01920 [Flammeovirga sp. SJP92]